MPNTPCRFSVLICLLCALMLTPGCTKQARKERHLKNANRYFEAKDFKKAEVEYLNVLRVDRTNAWVVTRLATIYYDQGKIQQAVPFLRGARDLDKNNAGAHPLGANLPGCRTIPGGAQGSFV